MDNSFQENCEGYFNEETIAETLHMKNFNVVKVKGKVEYDPTTRVYTLEDGSQAKVQYYGTMKLWVKL